MQASNRVILNTGVQYLRTFISVVISLYTARVVLENLGVNDYGIYTLVAGVISMLSFIQGNLSSTNVRFQSYFQGKGDKEKLQEIFNNSVTTQLLIGGTLCLLLLAITNVVFDHVLNIEAERITEAKVVYWLMLLSLFLNFMIIPFSSNVISHENIVFSSVVSILDSLLKLPIVISLIFVPWNKLEWYVTLMLGLTIFDFLCYYIYCRKKYEECRSYNIKTFNISLFREMFSFMGWNVYSTLCIVGRTQGIAILLNRFYSTAINAAYGIAFQVSAQVNFLSSALTTAIKPQIIKAEGGGNREKMFRLSELSCKYSFLLMSILTVPALMYMPTILEIWLKNVPDQTVMFCRYVLLAGQVDLISLNLNATNQAIGNVRIYSLCISTIKILTLPMALLFLILGYNAETVMIIYLVFETICAITRVVFLKINVNLSIRSYIKNVVVRIAPPFIVTCAICGILYPYLQGWLLLINFVVSLLTVSLITYIVGLSASEKALVQNLIRTIALRINRKTVEEKFT